MVRGLIQFRLAGALVACAFALAGTPSQAQGSYSPYNESPATAMARYVRTLASDPNDFQSLIGAGKAALEMGDAQAAAGFFARADEANPNSPLPQAGMGAVSVANGKHGCRNPPTCHRKSPHRPSLLHRILPRAFCLEALR